MNERDFNPEKELRERRERAIRELREVAGSLGFAETTEMARIREGLIAHPEDLASGVTSWSKLGEVEVDGVFGYDQQAGHAALVGFYVSQAALYLELGMVDEFYDVLNDAYQNAVIRELGQAAAVINDILST